LRSSYAEREEPLVRPSSTVQESCAEAVLVFGTNWYSTGTPQVHGSVALFNMNDQGLSFHEDEGVVHGHSHVVQVWGEPTPADGGTVTGPGNERRSWSVGFRCAYALPDLTGG
jgi:hypothetical protein